MNLSLNTILPDYNLNRNLSNKAMITHHTHLLLSIRRQWTICISFLLCLSAMAIDWHPQKCTNGKWGYTKYTSSYLVDYEKDSGKWLFKPEVF